MQMGKNKYKKNRFENIMLTRPFGVCFMAHREEAQNTIRQLQLHANCRNFFTKKDRFTHGFGRISGKQNSAKM